MDCIPFSGPMHCTENSRQIISEIKLCGLVPNSYIHVSVSDLYILTIGPKTQYSKIGGPCKEIAHIYMNAEIEKLETRPRSFISGNICLEFSVQCVNIFNRYIFVIWGGGGRGAPIVV
jgi:hypothetical protein